MKLKRLIKGMEETLMECHKRELLGHEPCDTGQPEVCIKEAYSLQNSTRLKLAN